MKFEHMASITCDLLKFVTWLSLITCTAFVRAEEPSQYFDFPLTSTENVHNLADDQSPSRPEQHLKPSMFDLLSPSPDQQGSNGAAFDTAPTQVDGLEKRVFCNGFTGCGGRFRARRRRPKTTVGKRLPNPRLIKRPFCNTHGCYNSGKRSGEVSSGDPQMDQASYSDDELMELKKKRLFCNGYGGCQNMGKRLLLLERLADQTNQQNGETRGLSGKRFFTGDFDSEADSLVDNMDRKNGSPESRKRIFTGDLDKQVDDLNNAMNRKNGTPESRKRFYTGNYDKGADDLNNSIDRKNGSPETRKRFYSSTYDKQVEDLINIIDRKNGTLESSKLDEQR